MEKTVFARIYSPWHSFIGGLDAELINIGFGKEVVLWNSHKPFTGDNFYRLYLPVKGAFRLNYMNESVVVEPGSIHLVPAHTPFTYESMTPSDHYWLHFLSKQLRTVPAFQSHLVLPLENPKKMRSEFENIFRQIRAARTVTDDLRVRNTIFAFLAPFLESALHELPQNTASEGGFAEVLEYIDRNLACVQSSVQSACVDYYHRCTGGYRYRQNDVWRIGLQSFQSRFGGPCVSSDFFPGADDFLAAGRTVDELYRR